MFWGLEHDGSRPPLSNPSNLLSSIYLHIQSRHDHDSERSSERLNHVPDIQVSKEALKSDFFIFLSLANHLRSLEIYG